MPRVEMPRGKAHKGHAVAVLGVHVGLHLEDKAGDGGFFGADLAFGGLLRLRFGAVFADAVHQFLHAERVDRRAEPDRRHVSRSGTTARSKAGSNSRAISSSSRNFASRSAGTCSASFGSSSPSICDRFRHLVAVGAVHDLQPVVQEVIGADEIAPHADGPACGRHVDGQVFLDLVDDLEGVAAFAVHLVAEGQDRQVAQAADLEQLAGLAFHALGAVDHHDRGIHGGQRAVGVFGKIAVAGGVDQVEAVLPEIEGHGRGRDRDAALLLHLHEVRPRAPRLALGAHLTRHLDGAAEQQELFGQRGLAGVGVRDDRKGPAAGDFGRQGGARFGHARRIAMPRAFSADQSRRKSHDQPIRARFNVPPQSARSVALDGRLRRVAADVPTVDPETARPASVPKCWFWLRPGKRARTSADSSGGRRLTVASFTIRLSAGMPSA